MKLILGFFIKNNVIIFGQFNLHVWKLKQMCTNLDIVTAFTKRVFNVLKVGGGGVF